MCNAFIIEIFENKRQKYKENIQKNKLRD